jgi:ferric-dicitrate binding protein FerR (iron transport regulator)
VKPGVRFLLCACVALLVLTAAACKKGPAALATLERFAGKVDRDHAAQVGTFAPATAGAQFFVGDGIRTAAQSRASLKLVDGSALALEPSTLVRFLERAPGGKSQRVDVELGQAELTAGDDALSIETAFGNALIQPRSKVVLTRSASGARFEVSLGSAVVDVKGQKRELGAGGKIEVGIDLAIIERAAASPSASAAPAAAPAPATGITADVDGNGAKIREAGSAEWKKLPPGTTPVFAGSALDLPSGTTAIVRTKDGETRLAGPGKFTIEGTSEALVETQSGSINLAPTNGTVSVAVPGGKIIAQAGSHASLRTEKDGTTVSVAGGAVTLEGTQGSETLHGGEEAVLARNGTVQRSRMRGLDYADILAIAGDSFVVHDPKPPTAVGFVVSAKCDGLAALELGGRGRGALVGDKTVNVGLPAGGHAYAVRCIGADGRVGEVTAKGTISVLLDAGTRRLPTSAPATFVDTDGRNYTVLYQNQLPAITVRWPKAASGSGYSLSVQSGGRIQSLQTGQASYTFPAGTLAEGAHQLTFETSGSRSRTTVLEIRFDNATPTASISSPADGSFGPGAAVLVSGTALPGWNVSASGTEIPQDEQHRFSGEVTAPSGERALAIRFAHPQRGTHYYLRRMAGAGR